jgi:hypothetical protein
MRVCLAVVVLLASHGLGCVHAAGAAQLPTEAARPEVGRTFAETLRKLGAKGHHHVLDAGTVRYPEAA